MGLKFKWIKLPILYSIEETSWHWATCRIKEVDHTSDRINKLIRRSWNAFVKKLIEVFVSISVSKCVFSNGALVYQSNLEDPRNFHATQCNPNEQFAILLHGWRESCNITWMRQLIGSKSGYKQSLLLLLSSCKCYIFDFRFRFLYVYMI